MDIQKHILLGDPIYASPKHLFMRSIMAGEDITLIDPEGEYQKLLASLVSGGRKLNTSVTKLESKTTHLNLGTDQENVIKSPLSLLNAPTE